MSLSSKEKLVAIACSSPSAFVRGHLHALSAGASSVLIPYHDRRFLTDIVRRDPDLAVYTDRPDDPAFTPFEVVDVRLLAWQQEFPRNAAADRQVALLCTETSTGAVKLVPVTHARVAGEARSLTQLFWDRTTPIRVVTTMPFEHIYGYQFGFFWPRFAGLEAPDGRAVLPSDVKTELARSSRPIWLVTTPAHLSALAEAGLRTDNVQHVFCAGEPLTPQHADEARRCFGVWPIEIYSGAETGTIGWREYDGRDCVWQCIPGKQLRRRHDGAIELRCPDFAAPEPIADSLDLVAPQRFRIVAHAEPSADSRRAAVAMGALDAA